MKKAFSVCSQFRQESSRMRHTMTIVALSILTLVANPLRHQQAARAAMSNFAQCQYVIAPVAQSFGARGGTGSLSILSANTCTWTTTSNAPWINFTSATTGSGVGRVSYSVIPNTGANQRTGVISVGSQTFTVTQAGTSAATCVTTPINSGQMINGALAPGDCLSPLRIKDGLRPLADRYTFNATAGQPVVISLSSTDYDTYLYLLDATGSVIAQNDDSITGSSSRIPANTGFFILPATGAFTIEVTSFFGSGVGNYALSLTMPAGNCTYSINPVGQAFPTNGGTNTVNVNTQAGCAWSALSNNSWLTITAAGGGSGPGAVNYTVAANSGSARTGTLTVAGLTFTVTQAGTNGTGCPTVTHINPTNGAPGSIVTLTGTNFTGVTMIKFANNIAAQFTAIADTQINATVPNGAVTGPLTISKPTCPDTQTPSFTANRLVVTVSAASFLGASLTSESIVAAFGTGLATGVEIANSLPLPTTLLGTTVKVRDSAGTERAAPLFFVAPTQINYLIPPNTATGAATVTVTSGDGIVSMGTVNIIAAAPGLFAANANGQGVAAANVLRLKADGSQSFEPVATFDSARNQFVSVPIDLGPELGNSSDQLFLILFGTGLRFRSTLSAVVCTIGGANAEVFYAGAQGVFVGLDQLNVRLPRSLKGRGEVDIVLLVDGKAANTVRVNIK